MDKSNEQKFVEDFMNFVFDAEPQLSLTDAKFIDYINKNLKLVNSIKITSQNKTQIEKHIEQEFFSVIAKKQKVVFSNSGYIITFKESFDKIIDSFDSSKVQQKNKGPVKNFVNFICEKLMSLSSQYQAYCFAITQNVVVESAEIKNLFKDLEECKTGVSDLVESLNKSKEELENRQEKVKKEIKGSQHKLKKEIEESKRKANETGIAILGIFSALVLAFNGAIIFSSATLESMNTTSIYRLLISIVTLGIVFINIAYALFHFISALIERNSLIKRQNTPESENKDAKSKKKGSKLFDRTHLIIINFVTLLIIIAIVCCWNFGVVEKRNQRLEQELTSMVEISDTNTTTIDDLTEMNNVEY